MMGYGVSPGAEESFLLSYQVRVELSSIDEPDGLPLGVCPLLSGGQVCSCEHVMPFHRPGALTMQAFVGTGAMH